MLLTKYLFEFFTNIMYNTNNIYVTNKKAYNELHVHYTSNL